MTEYGGKLVFIDEAARRVQDTTAQLRGRGGQAASGLQLRTTQAEAGLRARGERASVGLRERAEAVTGEVETAAARRTTPDLAAMQASVRSVITYIRQNPVPAALLALGAGVVAATMWKEQAGRGGRSRQRRR